MNSWQFTDSYAYGCVLIYVVDSRCIMTGPGFQSSAREDYLLLGLNEKNCPLRTVFYK